MMIREPARGPLQAVPAAQHLVRYSENARATETKTPPPPASYGIHRRILDPGMAAGQSIPGQAGVYDVRRESRLVRHRLKGSGNFLVVAR